MNTVGQAVKVSSDERLGSSLDLSQPDKEGRRMSVRTLSGVAFALCITLLGCSAVGEEVVANSGSTSVAEAGESAPFGSSLPNDVIEPSGNPECDPGDGATGAVFHTDPAAAGLASVQDALTAFVDANMAGVLPEVPDDRVLQSASSLESGFGASLPVLDGDGRVMAQQVVYRGTEKVEASFSLVLTAKGGWVVTAFQACNSIYSERQP